MAPTDEDLSGIVSVLSRRFRMERGGPTAAPLAVSCHHPDREDRRHAEGRRVHPGAGRGRLGLARPASWVGGSHVWLEAHCEPPGSSRRTKFTRASRRPHRFERMEPGGFVIHYEFGNLTAPDELHFDARAGDGDLPARGVLERLRLRRRRSPAAASRPDAFALRVVQGLGRRPPRRSTRRRPRRRAASRPARVPPAGTRTRCSRRPCSRSRPTSRERRSARPIAPARCRAWTSAGRPARDRRASGGTPSASQAFERLPADEVLVAGHGETEAGLER